MFCPVDQRSKYCFAVICSINVFCNHQFVAVPFRFEIVPGVTVVNKNIEDVSGEILSNLLQFIFIFFDGWVVMQDLESYQPSLPQGVVSGT